MNAFEVFVVFSAVDHLSGPMARMARDMGILCNQSDALQRRLAGFKNMAFVGGAITGFGAVMAKGLLSAADAAGRLQLSLLSVKQQLGWNNAQFEKAQKLAQNVGIPTVFNAEQVGGMMYAMAQGGMGNRVLDAGVLRNYVNFADVRAMRNHEEGSDTVSAAVQMAHAFQIYSVKASHQFLDDLNAGLSVWHGTTREFQTQFGYFAGNARLMGMSAKDSIATEVFMQRMGLERSGTSLNQFLAGVLPHTSGNPKRDATHFEAMQRAGFIDAQGHSVFMRNGQFVGMEQSAKILMDFSKRFGGNIEAIRPILHDIFNERGMRAAEKLMGKGALEQLHDVYNGMRKVASVDKQQLEFNEQWDGQMRQLKSTMLDIWSNFGKYAIPNLIKVLKHLNSIGSVILEFTQDNPALMTMVANFAEFAAASSLVVGPLMLIKGAMGYLFEGGIINAGIGMVWTAFRGFFSWQTVALGLLVTAWINDWGHIREFVNESFGKFTKWSKDYFHASEIGSAKVAWNWAKHHKTMEETSSQFKIDQLAMWSSIQDAVEAFNDKSRAAFDATFKFIKDGLTGIDDWLTEHGYGSASAKTSYQNEADETQNDLWRQHYGQVGKARRSPAGMWNMLKSGGGYYVTPGDRHDLQQYNESQAQPVPSPAPTPAGNTGMTGGTVHIQNLTVNQQPGQSPKALVQDMMREIGMAMRNRSYASPDTPISAW